MFYGWWILSGLVVLRLTAGIGNNVPSLLVLPLEEEFGASRASISLMSTTASISIALTSTIGGWLMDRFGTRKVMLVCILLATAGCACRRRRPCGTSRYFAVSLGFAYNWAMFNSGAAFVNNWFERRKATALSMLNVGPQAAGA